MSIDLSICTVSPTLPCSSFRPRRRYQVPRFSASDLQVYQGCIVLLQKEAWVKSSENYSKEQAAHIYYIYIYIDTCRNYCRTTSRKSTAYTKGISWPQFSYWSIVLEGKYMRAGTFGVVVLKGKYMLGGTFGVVTQGIHRLGGKMMGCFLFLQRWGKGCGSH